MNDEDVIKAVGLRYRIGKCLISSAICWSAGGQILRHFAPDSLRDSPYCIGILVTGWAMYVIAFAVTFAIYRCPVCDHFLKRFRPRKDQCGHCGAKVA